MKIETEILKSRNQSAQSMYKCAEWIYDLGTHLDSTLLNFYKFVQAIPYLEDSNFSEVVGRPKYLLNPKTFKGLDCKKKAVLILSWALAHNIPSRLIASSQRPDKKIHHVFTQLKIEGEWKTVDPTYPQNQGGEILFSSKPDLTAAEELIR